jgi:hypothetical protein
METLTPAVIAFAPCWEVKRKDKNATAVVTVGATT